MTEAKTALKRHRGGWPSAQPGQAEVRAWLVEWQAHLADSRVLGGVLPSNSDALAGG